MPELVVLKTEHYECVIWSKNIIPSQQRMEQTMLLRGLSIPASVICLSPPLTLDSEDRPLKEKNLGQPVFFENRQYDIEFVFDTKIANHFGDNLPFVEHRLKLIEDAFHYSARSHSLRANIHTGNDIGWFRIQLVYWCDNKRIQQSFAFEVMPTKMDMASDLRVMNTAIDEHYPLWRYSLAEKTQHQMKAVKKPHPQFLLLWLAQFESLQDAFLQGLKHVVNAPHSRLVGVRQSVRIDRLKGKLSPKLELAVASAKLQKRGEKRFQLDKKHLDIDTPENRFIKFVINTSITKLAKVCHQIRQNQNAPEKQSLSDSFFKKLSNWQGSLRHFQRQPLFREVGEFRGLSSESLVLQQKPGYARVYKIWQQLKWYLELLDGQSSLSLRSVAELYEVWCFLEVRRILLCRLKFKETENKQPLLINNGTEVSMKDGMAGSFKFHREDGIKLRLAHEPIFKRNGAPIKSWITTQKPDILLEATLTDGNQFVWLFDAKYRIKTDTNNDSTPDEKLDYVPDDAINQMHRYRDALIHQDKILGANIGKSGKKTRPVFGAYALYPGFFNQSSPCNPYTDAINEIGVGAFSLLPDVKFAGSIWLEDFLTEKLGKLPKNDPKVTTNKFLIEEASSDKYFVEEAPRIPYLGTTISKYTDLTIATSGLGPDRSSDYVKQFEKGEAEFYHTRFHAFERQKIEHHVVLEARYLAVAIDKKLKKARQIKFIYPILNAQHIKRKLLTQEQTGTDKINNSDELYWLFTLGKALVLKKPVEKSWQENFQLKLIGRDDLSGVTNWDHLPERYSSLLK